MEWMKLNSLLVEGAMLNLWIKQDTFTTNIIFQGKKSGGSVVNIINKGLQLVRPEQQLKDFALPNLQTPIPTHHQNLLNVKAAERKRKN